ncbi:hypothetical protein LOZ53_005124 [Ophidiomyces ophidiicola]|nr:hypothetical protein LOZ55_005939 [Ophidiomyces ophidiicola]KAI1985300.1 hypothetical protein LOZ53_005124 [Ophidiomyces ophidiicola]KAI1986613.1 hypothetical protein LOZ54_003831 [Ophidiomyces ophidiicola]
MPQASQTFPPQNPVTSYFPPPRLGENSALPGNFQMYSASMNQLQNKGVIPQPAPSKLADDQEIATDIADVDVYDAMDIDSREEGELSSGETEPAIINAQSAPNLAPLEALGAQNQTLSAKADNSTTIHIASDTPATRQPVSEDKNISESHVPNAKSLNQMRVQAQGALLNLAPHNIRYKELVNEGVDPIILKSLYEGIGLKVSTEEFTRKNSHNERVGSDVSLVNEDSRKKSGLLSNPIGIGHSTMLLAKGEKNSAHPATSSITAGKPLERKDLIARMLAAKAGKSVTTQNLQQDTTSFDSAKENIPPPEAASNIADSCQPLSEEARSKEKNKAQTELARQRIEQLKKNGLLKSQSQSASASVSGSPSGPSSTTTSNIPEPMPSPQDVRPLQPLPMKHPLPEKPPDPAVTEPTSTRIPGLFMTNVESADQKTSQSQNDRSVSTLEVSSSIVRLPRKRPRASDFTDDVVEEPPQKQIEQDHRNSGSGHKVIIDISDEESIYGPDAEESSSSHNTSMGMSTASTISKPLAIRENAQFSDIPPRSIQSFRSPSSGTLPQAPIKGRDEGNIRSEILIMRQRIAELEKRRDAKRAAQAQSTTPVRSDQHPIMNLPPEQKVQTPQQLQRFNPADNSPANTSYSPALRRTVPENIPSSPIATPLNSPSARSWPSLEPKKAAELRQKFLRKKEIESGLPVLDAELSKSEAKLAHFREEEKKLLAEIAKGKAGKRRLVEELEELGVETDGLTLEELQLTRERLEAGLEEHEVIPGQTQGDPTIPGFTNVPQHPVSGSIPDSTLEYPLDQLVERPLSPDSSTFAKIQETSQEAINDATETLDCQDISITDRQGSVSSSRCSSAMDESMGSSEDEEKEEEAMTQDDFVPCAGTPTSGTSVSIDQATDSSQEQPVTENPSVIHSENGESDQASLSEHTTISDAYEPPEPMATIKSSSSATSTNSLTLPANANPPTLPLVENVKTLTLADKNVQPVENCKENDTKEPNIYFTPYISPLRLFKAYRYHPNFVKDISQGFRSLTYSHNIDPNRSLCTFEAAGGVCNDQSCSSQHFRDMTLSGALKELMFEDLFLPLMLLNVSIFGSSAPYLNCESILTLADDKILVEMGSLREGKTQAERDAYVTGLKQTINDMRRDKVKDFNTVATEIAAYRRRFLQDPSRILPL